MSGDWPLVDPRDDGIRPAGRPDECFYCHRRVGYTHGRECVIVQKRVEMRVTAKLPGSAVTGRWVFDEPHEWDEVMSEFHKNESSWCANNFLDECAKPGAVEWDDGADPWAELEALVDDESGRCLCGVLSFEFVRVVDPTPRRSLNRSVN